MFPFSAGLSCAVGRGVCSYDAVWSSLSVLYGGYLRPGTRGEVKKVFAKLKEELIICHQLLWLCCHLCKTRAPGSVP